MKIDIFSTGPMEAYAALITHQLGVDVVMRGTEIKASINPPRIFLPNMENAPKDAVEVLFGFCLHEAGHIKYTDYKVGENVKDYFTFTTANAIEDVRIERKLEREFPGGRETLKYSYVNAMKIVVNEKPLLEPKEPDPMLDDVRAGRKFVKEEVDALHRATGATVPEIVAKTGLDPDDEKTCKLYANRHEFLRVLRHWIAEKRRYGLDLHDWPKHPWRPIFEEVTAVPARSTKQSHEQARTLIDRLGLAFASPSDKRPVDDVKAAVKNALGKMAEAKEALSKVAEIERERENEINRRVERGEAYQDAIEARNAAIEARERRKEASRDLKRKRDQLREARTLARITRDRLASERERLKLLMEEKAAAAEPPASHDPLPTDDVQRN